MSNNSRDTWWRNLALVITEWAKFGVLMLGHKLLGLPKNPPNLPGH